MRIGIPKSYWRSFYSMRWFVILAVSSVVIGTSAVVLTVVIFWQFIFGIILALLLYTLLLLRAECKVCPEAK